MPKGKKTSNNSNELDLWTLEAAENTDQEVNSGGGQQWTEKVFKKIPEPKELLIKTLPNGW